MNKFSTAKISNTAKQVTVLSIFMFPCSVIIWLVYIHLHESTYKSDSDIITQNRTTNFIANTTKYILQWTSTLTYMGKGKSYFIHHKCDVQDCFVTDNKTFFSDLQQFDALVFYGKLLREGIELPAQRSENQKYVLDNMESSYNFPICTNDFNNFFNWTWTYKLNSDLVHSYFVIRDKQNNIIGPQKSMHWIKIENMLPINDDIKKKLDRKSKLVAWFVSNCNAASQRSLFVMRLQQILVEKYQLDVDIYGSCGKLKCIQDKQVKGKSCWDMIEQEYFFYLSFENSFSKDYVTEKLLNPLQHYTVPVVYGSANYTKFMPNGIYLNALQLGPRLLAEEMFDAMNDKERYYNFFKWHNHYSYHNAEEAPDSNSLCEFCELLHDERAMTTNTVYKNIAKWWNPPEPTKCLKSQKQPKDKLSLE